MSDEVRISYHIQSIVCIGLLSDVQLLGVRKQKKLSKKGTLSLC